MFALTIVIVFFLLFLSALFSGLTLGLMSLKPHELRRKMRLGNKNAKRIYPLRKNGNILLCTLLLGNVLVNSVLSIFLGSITVGVLAAILATGLIVIFGEILPQAFFSRYALKFGAKTAWITESFLILLYPFTWPLAKGLDLLLGQELPHAYSRRELSFIIEEQGENKDAQLDNHEVDILRGTLSLAERTVQQAMTPRRLAFFLDANARVTSALLQRIHRRAYSRIPVYEGSRDTIVGVLFTKDLILLDHKSASQTVRVRDVMRPSVSYIGAHRLLDDVLLAFQSRRSHLFVVRSREKRVVGIITLEDVLEEIVGEIFDEHDE